MKEYTNDVVLQATCGVYKDNNIVGCAFLIEHGYLLSSGHLFIKYSFHETFNVIFPNYSFGLADLKYYIYDDSSYIDFAILKMSETMNSVTPLKLSFSFRFAGGFVSAGTGQELGGISNAIGQIAGKYIPPDIDNGIYMVKLQSEQAHQCGFSGSAIYSVEEDAVIAIQSLITNENVKAERNTVLAFPLERLKGYIEKNDFQKVMECDENGIKKIVTNMQENYRAILAELYWKVYDEIGVQKSTGKLNEYSEDIYDLQGKLIELYQFPNMLGIINNQTKSTWNLSKVKENGENIILFAPNGYGKSSLLKSILLSSLMDVKKDLNDNEKKRMKEIYEFHGLFENAFPIFLECRNIDFDNLVGEVNHSWIYKALSEEIILTGRITEEDFRKVLVYYNKLGKLFFMIDGYDEINREKREKLLNRLKMLKQDTEVGLNAFIIISSRPLFFAADFKNFSIWSIDSICINDNSKKMELIENYVKVYCKQKDNTCFDTVYNQIINNIYLKETVVSPVTLVCIIKQCMWNNEISVCLMIEKTLEEMMNRYDYNYMILHTYEYKKVYMELAYFYLKNLTNKDGIDCNRNMFHNQIKIILRDLNFRNIEEDFVVGKDGISEMLLTNISLVELQKNKLKFFSLIFACHLAAEKLLQLLDVEKDTKKLEEWLNKIDYKYRYTILLMLSAIGKTLSITTALQITNSMGIQDDLSEWLHDYIYKRWESEDACMEEKRSIQNAVSHILSKEYGTTVFDNCTEYIESFQRIQNNDILMC